MDEYRRTLLLGWPAAFALATSVSNAASAQELPTLPPELSKDPHVGKLVELIELWNQRELKLPQKKALQEFFDAQIDGQVGERSFGYETPEWGGRAKEAFAALPDAATPKLPFSPSASAVLTLAYGINISSVQQQFPKPEDLFIDPNNLNQRLALSTFVVFGGTQQRIANRGEEKPIPVDDVIAILFGWWTKVWPFCAWKF